MRQTPRRQTALKKRLHERSAFIEKCDKKRIFLDLSRLLPSFIISETPNGVLYGLGNLFTPGVAGGYSPQTPNGVFIWIGVYYIPRHNVLTEKVNAVALNLSRLLRRSASPNAPNQWQNKGQ